MKYFISEDEFYYSKKGQDEILRQHPELERIHILPEYADIKKIITGTGEGIARLAFLAPYPPEAVSERFRHGHFFEIFELPNRYGILTTGQKRAEIPMETILEERLGTTIIRSPFKMSDYAGADPLHKQVEIVKQRFHYGRTTKGFLLAGIPGTGKSFFAECLAGELDFLMVRLNIVKFMEKPNPVTAIDLFFDFFSRNPGDYVVWIDEIEKMFHSETSQEIMGVLLTRLNEAGRESGGDSARFFTVATANNISYLSKQNPEFFRSGRFDEVIFLKNPTEANAKKIMELYFEAEAKALLKRDLPIAVADMLSGDYRRTGIVIEKMAQAAIDFLGISPGQSVPDLLSEKREEVIRHLRSLFPTFDFSHLVRYSTSKYRSENLQADRFIYTPAEIKHIVARIWEEHLYGPPVDTLSIIKRIIDSIRPLQSTMKGGMQDLKAAGYHLLQI